MTAKPGFGTRMVARLHGEIPAAAVEAYRRAGAEVYDLIGEFDQSRADWGVHGVTAWTAPTSTQITLLAAWSAFALQVLGDEMIDADYAADPSTPGYLPPVTARQALAFYGPVPTWLAIAREAQASESFKLDVTVPTALPPFVAVEPCPLAHLAAMRAATARLRTQAEATLSGFSLGDDAPQQQANDKIKELRACATADDDYATRLWADRLPPDVHTDVERHLKTALEGYFELGQLLAMPAAALQPRSTPSRHSNTAGGPSDFDPWCLTDPESRDQWQHDRQAQRSIEALWANDSNPEATLRTHGEIDAALANGDIGYAVDSRGHRIGHYYCCPWSPIYVVKRPTILGGVHLQPMEQFTFDVSAEEITAGGSFKRNVLVANFHPTTEVDYCDPGS